MLILISTIPEVLTLVWRLLVPCLDVELYLHNTRSPDPDLDVDRGLHNIRGPDPGVEDVSPIP
jgi:hypothetical protein